MLGLGVASVLNGTETVPRRRDAQRRTSPCSPTSRTPSQHRASGSRARRRSQPPDQRAAADRELPRSRDRRRPASRSSLAVGVLTRDQVRAWIGAAADGDSIVRVGATTRNQELSFRLAEATINSYRDWVVDADVAQSTSTEQSLEARVDEKQAAVDAAEPAVTDKIIEQPEVDHRGPLAGRPAASSGSCRRRPTAPQASWWRPRTRSTQAKLQTDQAAGDRRPAAPVLDEPELPPVSKAGLRDAALTLIVFGVLGAILSLATVVVSAMLDRTIRVPNDITGKFGVDVLAVVPRRRSLRRRPMAKRTLASRREEAARRRSRRARWLRRRRPGDPRRGRQAAPHHPSPVAVVAALLPRPCPAARRRGPAVAAGADVGARRRGRHVHHPVAGLRDRLRHRGVRRRRRRQLAQADVRPRTAAGDRAPPGLADAVEHGAPLDDIIQRTSNPRLSPDRCRRSRRRPPSGAGRQQGAGDTCSTSSKRSSTTCCSTCRRCSRRARR